jgi:type IV pilus assembly protein PilC
MADNETQPAAAPVQASQPEVKAKKDKPKKEPVEFSIGGVPTLDIVLSIRQISIILKSSLAIEDVLKSLTEQSFNPKLKRTYKLILADIQSGQSLSESMEKHPKVFSNIVISIIRAGEQGGMLEKNLVYLADYLKKDYELKKKVKGAMFYPIMVMGLTFVEAFGVIFFILPKLENLFSSFKNVPPFTKAMMSSTKYIRENVVMIGIILAVVLGLLIAFLKTKQGKIFKDNLALKMPILKKLTKHGILANFSRSLGILLDSGIPIMNALKISSDTVDNTVYSKILTDIHEQVKNGKSLTESLSRYPDYFPATFTKLIEVGERTGTLEENLMYLHEFYADDVEDMSNNLATLLEPFLLVFIGLMIGGLAILIIGPIYQLTGSINE